MVSWARFCAATVRWTLNRAPNCRVSHLRRLRNLLATWMNGEIIEMLKCSKVPRQSQFQSSKTIQSKETNREKRENECLVEGENSGAIGFIRGNSGHGR